MSNVFSKLFFYLKFVLIIAAFILTFWGLTFTYQRLEKPMSEAVGALLPFGLVFLVFVINLFVSKKECSENLLFNFGCFLVLTVIILIGLRAKFDTNMLIYHKYAISYNPAYLADNLAMAQSMLYLVFVSNILLIVGGLFGRKKKSQKMDIKDEEA